MRIDTDGKGNLLIQADGHDGEIIIITKHGNSVHYVERDGELFTEGCSMHQEAHIPFQTRCE